MTLTIQVHRPGRRGASAVPRRPVSQGGHSCHERFRVAALLVVPMVLPISLLGQAPSIAVEAGRFVRVLTVEGRTHEAEVASVALDTLFFSSSDTRIHLADIDRLWVRGHSARPGAWVGGSVLGAASFGFFAWVCGAVADTSDGCEDWGAVAVFSVGGAGAGALLGAIVGGAIPRWQLRYDRSKTIIDIFASCGARVGICVRATL